MSSQDTSFFGHPRGLAVLFFAEMWERFSYYGMRGLLILYLTKHWLFSDGVASGIYASYAALVYLMPVIGGLVADRYLGFRKAVTYGAILLCLGHLGMAVEGEPATVVGAAVVRDGFLFTNFLFVLSSHHCWGWFVENQISPALLAVFMAVMILVVMQASPFSIWVSISVRCWRR